MVLASIDQDDNAGGANESGNAQESNVIGVESKMKEKVRTKLSKYYKSNLYHNQAEKFKKAAVQRNKYH
jgi:hypothetical protein